MRSAKTQAAIDKGACPRCTTEGYYVWHDPCPEGPVLKLLPPFKARGGA